MNLLRKLLLEKKDKRPPFLRAPLNAPGASLRDKLDEKVDALGSGVVVGPGVILILFSMSPLFKSNIQHIVLLVLLIAAWLLWLVFRGRKLLEEVRTTRLGYLGEVVIGQELERTRACGCSVYHDIVLGKPRSKFNIDHVLIGEVGVMVFETKAKAKPLKGDPKIWMKDGVLFFFDGRKSTKELEQARRNQKTMQKFLLQLINDSNKASLRRFTKKNPLPMQSCLVFPGWHVDYNSARGSDVSLSNDAMLFNFVSSQCKTKQPLSPKEAVDLNEILDAYLRKKKEHLIEA